MKTKLIRSVYLQLPKIRYNFYFPYFLTLVLCLLTSVTYALNVSISGASNICPNQPYTYTANVSTETGIEPCGNTYAYIWSVLKNGVTVISNDPNNPIGTYSASSNTFTPTFPNELGDYEVTVSIPKPCIWSNPGGAIKAVTVALRQIGPISGTSNLCAGQSYVFSLPGNNDATSCYFHYSYTRLVPTGWTVTAVNGNQFTVAVPQGTPSGAYQISVYGNHPLGPTPTSSLDVHVGNNTSPMNIEGDNPNAPGPYCAGDVALFRVTNPQPGIVYTWTVSQANIISGQGTAEIEVKFNSSIYSNIGTAKVTSSGCTTSPTSTLYFDLEDCNAVLSMSPNPASSELDVNFSSAKREDKSIYLLSESGVIYKSINTQSERVVINVSKLPEGMYYLKVVTYNSETIKKLLISR